MDTAMLLALLLLAGSVAMFLLAKKRHAAPAGVGQLQILDETPGEGESAAKGDRVAVHYTGRLHGSGKKFDSSLDRGEPFLFTLGARRVIAGWEQGVIGMRPGGKRRLVIPPHLGYGDRGAPPSIPPGATLEFDIELLEIK